MTLLIQNARCWNGGGFHTADVLLQGGKIKSLGTSISSDGVNALFLTQGVSISLYRVSLMCMCISVARFFL